MEQRGPISGNSEEYRKDEHIVIVKRVVHVDEDGNIIKYGATGLGLQYSIPAWGIRGHDRTLQDGRVIHISPYPKGKEWNILDKYVKKVISLLRKR